MDKKIKAVICSSVMAACFIFSSFLSYAGSINGNESMVLAALQQTYEWQGKNYRVLPSYISSASGYFMRDDVELSAEMAREAVATIQGSVGEGVAGGYMAAVENTGPQGDGENEAKKEGATKAGDKEKNDDTEKEEGSGNKVKKSETESELKTETTDADQKSEEENQLGTKTELHVPDEQNGQKPATEGEEQDQKEKNGEDASLEVPLFEHIAAGNTISGQEEARLEQELNEAMQQKTGRSKTENIKVQSIFEQSGIVFFYGSFIAGGLVSAGGIAALFFLRKSKRNKKGMGKTSICFVLLSGSLILFLTATSLWFSLWNETMIIRKTAESDFYSESARSLQEGAAAVTEVLGLPQSVIEGIFPQRTVYIEEQNYVKELLQTGTASIPAERAQQQAYENMESYLAARGLKENQAAKKYTLWFSAQIQKMYEDELDIPFLQKIADGKETGRRYCIGAICMALIIGLSAAYFLYRVQQYPHRFMRALAVGFLGSGITVIVVSFLAQNRIQTEGTVIVPAYYADLIKTCGSQIYTTMQYFGGMALVAAVAAAFLIPHLKRGIK